MKHSQERENSSTFRTKVKMRVFKMMAAQVNLLKIQNTV